jgi:hypothetical protein
MGYADVRAVGASWGVAAAAAALELAREVTASEELNSLMDALWELTAETAAAVASESGDRAAAVFEEAASSAIKNTISEADLDVPVPPIFLSRWNQEA